MRIDVISIFPAMFDAVARSGITARALERKLWSLERWNPRDFADNAYRRIDDRPYGGGPGMVMQAEPLGRALHEVRQAQLATLVPDNPVSVPVVLMSPQGTPVSHRQVADWSELPALTIIAGRYEGVDQRFIDSHVTDTCCVGDFVVSGGELPAMMLMDAVVRLLPGAVNDPESVAQESFATGLLDWPHYTRPEVLTEGTVPPVLTSGDHDKIARWRRGQALLTTQRVRPGLIEQLRSAGELSPQDEDWLAGRLGD